MNEQVLMVCNLIKQRRKTKNLEWGLVWDDNIRENGTECCPLQAAIDEKTGKHGLNYNAIEDAITQLGLDCFIASDIVTAADIKHHKALTWQQQAIRDELENACFGPV